MLPVNWYPACSAVTPPANAETSSTMNRLPTPMFHASVNARGTQIRTSESPRMQLDHHHGEPPRMGGRAEGGLADEPGELENRRLHGGKGYTGKRGAGSGAIFSRHATRSRPRIPEFRRRLLRWFRKHGRDLPWRRTRDPYHIVVSEFMLQQTQVSRVQEYYPRFLARYPTIQDLAAARPGEVRESWEGLGYYRRAANLHRLAVSGGGPPRRVASLDDVAELRRLPGIGRYTAGAVAAFAYERPEPAVDTNVGRVIRRAFGPRRRTLSEAETLEPRRPRSSPAGGRAPGRSARESWNSAPSSAPPGWRAARSARSGRPAGREAGSGKTVST